MKYNFDEKIERRGTNSVKWNVPANSDIIPLWVADMDFQAAPPIIDALNNRTKHGIFGYVNVPDAYYDAIINWFSRRHQWEIQKDWIQYTIGVVPAISAIIKGLCEPGEQVIIQTPVYNCFFSSIKNNGCEIITSPLIYSNHRYEMDYDNLEKIAGNPKAKILLLCNPHNPAGRAWNKDELTKVAEICKRNNVVVVSDEIHCELEMPGFSYTPFATVSDDALNNCIVCTSPSKSFNIAGLQIANIICNNKDWRDKIDRAININEVCDVNPYGVEALIAAYNNGEDWLKELCCYIYDNYLYLKEFFHDNFPQYPVINLEATYLAWVDIKTSNLTSDEMTDMLLNKAHVWVNSGTMYGPEGEGFIRINLATQKSVLKEALNRMKKVL